MENVYLVNYQAVYWDVNKSPLINQKEISFPIIEASRLSDGESLGYEELIDNFESNSYERNTTKTY